MRSKTKNTLSTPGGPTGTGGDGSGGERTWPIEISGCCERVMKSQLVKPVVTPGNTQDEGGGGSVGSSMTFSARKRALSYRAMGRYTTSTPNWFNIARVMSVVTVAPVTGSVCLSTKPIGFVVWSWLLGLPTRFVRLNGAHSDPSHTVIGCTVSLQGTAPLSGCERSTTQLAAAALEARQAAAKASKNHAFRLKFCRKSLIGCSLIARSDRGFARALRGC